MTSQETRFHSLCEDLHTNVENLMKILANNVSNSSSFELRRTARSIQRLLQNSEFLTSFRSALQLLSGVSYSTDLAPNTTASLEIEQLVEVCEGLVSDLMNLVTMTTVLYNDANAVELLRLLQHLSLDLLHILPSFEPAWLEKLLDYILALMQASVSSQYSLLSNMVVLFNQHVSSQDELQVIFAEHRSAFGTTCVALNFLKDRQTEIPTTESIPIEFAIFVDSLVSFCTICTIEAAPTGDTLDAKIDSQASRTWQGESMDLLNLLHDETPRDYRSVSYELAEEAQLPNTACSMQADAHFYVATLDAYGTQLVELSLLLLGELNQDVLNSQLNSERMNSSSSDMQVGGGATEASRTQKLAKSDSLQVLSYATLATNFVCATASITQQASTLRGADRSLLKGLVNFMLHSEGSMYLQSFASPPSLVGVNGADCGADNTSLRTAVVATDALWRLTQLYSASQHPEDAPLIVASMFFVWKYAEHGTWPTQYASNFLRSDAATHPPQIHKTLAQDLRGGDTPLHHCLQTLLVAHTLFPSQQFPTLPVIEIFQRAFSVPSEGGQGMHENQPNVWGARLDASLGHAANQLSDEAHMRDPWKSWVFDQILE